MVQDGVALVFNGQEYEHDALREELRTRGHAFVTTRSDTEVVLRAYLEWGESFAERLHGNVRDRDLGFAQGAARPRPRSDGQEAAPLRARDWRSGRSFLSSAPPKIGERVFAQRIIFGSELKALLAHGAVRARLDPDALVQYLAGEAVPAPRTIFRSVRKLPAGCTAVFDARGFRVRRYWELPAPPLAAQYQPGQRERCGLALRRAARPAEAARASSMARSPAPARRRCSGRRLPLRRRRLDRGGRARGPARGQSAATPFRSASAKPRSTRPATRSSPPERIGSRAPDLQKFSSGKDCTDLLARCGRDARRAACRREHPADAAPLEIHAPPRDGGAGRRRRRRAVRRLRPVPRAPAGGTPLPLAARRARASSRPRGALPSSSKNMSFDFRLKQFLRGVDAQPSLRHQSWLASFLPAELSALLSPDRAPPARHRSSRFRRRVGQDAGAQRHWVSCRDRSTRRSASISSAISPTIFW